LRDLTTANFHDSCGIDDPVLPHQNIGSLRLFGNANIGNVHLCNLPAAGRVTFDTLFVVQRWYARTNLPTQGPVRDFYERWAHSVNVDFTLGEMPYWHLNLFELDERRPRWRSDSPLSREPPDPWPFTIQVRQNISVRIDNFGYQQLEDLRAAIRREPSPVIQPRIWIHFEGVFVRQGMVAAYFTDNPVRRKALSIEDRIVHWIAGIAEQTDDIGKAQLAAIADGILEGRHRS